MFCLLQCNNSAVCLSIFTLQCKVPHFQHFLIAFSGAGYHLIIVKEKTCLVSRITELVKSHIASAALESEISAELSYLLPFDESENFEKLLLEIEERSVELCITSFGTTATTMEEVFLK